MCIRDRNDSAVSGLLADRGIDLIDVAPGKYFSDIPNTKDSEIFAVRKAWSDRGVSIRGMQALLYGTSGLNLFGSDESAIAMLDHLRSASRIAAGLGAKYLTFGSPKNRDRSGLSDEQVETRSHEFFRKLGDIAAEYDVIICLEPNPITYGANFMTTTPDTAAVVSKIAHPAIKMQLDTGAMALNDESADSIAAFLPFVAHVHASEPNLRALTGVGMSHREIGQVLQGARPDLTVTVEMLTPSESDPLPLISRALDIAVANYRTAR